MAAPASTWRAKTVTRAPARVRHRTWRSTNVSEAEGKCETTNATASSEAGCSDVNGCGAMERWERRAVGTQGGGNAALAIYVNSYASTGALPLAVGSAVVVPA